jgi:hypothetical protein
MCWIVVRLAQELAEEKNLEEIVARLEQTMLEDMRQKANPTPPAAPETSASAIYKSIFGSQPKIEEESSASLASSVSEVDFSFSMASTDASSIAASEAQPPRSKAWVESCWTVTSHHI